MRSAPGAAVLRELQASLSNSRRRSQVAIRAVLTIRARLDSCLRRNDGGAAGLRGGGGGGGGAGSQTDAKRSWGGVLLREPHCELSRILAGQLDDEPHVANVSPRIGVHIDKVWSHLPRGSERCSLSRCRGVEATMYALVLLSLNRQVRLVQVALLRESQRTAATVRSAQLSAVRTSPDGNRIACGFDPGGGENSDIACANRVSLPHR